MSSQLTDAELAALMPSELCSYQTPIPTQIVSSDEYTPPPQSEKQREVFLGCHEQGLTLDAVAAKLGMAPGTARSHLHRALATLRDSLRTRSQF